MCLNTMYLPTSVYNLCLKDPLTNVKLPLGISFVFRNGPKLPYYTKTLMDCL